VEPAFKGAVFIGVTGTDTALAYKSSDASKIFLKGIQITDKYKDHTVGGIIALPADSFIIAIREGDDVASLNGMNAGRPIVATIQSEKSKGVSSTAIKKALKDHKSIDDLVSPGISKIIAEKKLYQE
jgi:hypothetical protein